MMMMKLALLLIIGMAPILGWVPIRSYRCVNRFTLLNFATCSVYYYATRVCYYHVYPVSLGTGSSFSTPATPPLIVISAAPPPPHPPHPHRAPYLISAIRIDIYRNVILHVNMVVCGVWCVY